MTATYRATGAPPRAIRDPASPRTVTRRPHRRYAVVLVALLLAAILVAVTVPSPRPSGRWCGTPDGVTADRITACMDMPVVR